MRREGRTGEVKWREREVEENEADRETRCEEQRWRETEEKLKIEKGKRIGSGKEMVCTLALVTCAKSCC